MADFCKQCSIDTFGEDFGDMAELSTPQDTENGLYPVVLCEGCGPTQVDHTGMCISDDCIELHGGKPIPQTWAPPEPTRWQRFCWWIKDRIIPRRGTFEL